MIRTIIVIALVCLSIWGLIDATKSQGEPQLVECDTDIDCMIKNPHIKFSLESN